MAENMDGKYPVMIDGRAVGTLEVSRHGAVTVFDVRCRMLEGIVRVSVYGQDSEGYLGVLAPEGEGLRLRRSLSPAAMRTLPRDIVEAGPAGLGRASIPVLPDVPERPGESDADAGEEYAAANVENCAGSDSSPAKPGETGKSSGMGRLDAASAADGGPAAVRTDSSGEMDASGEAARPGAAGVCPDEMSDDRPGEPAEGSGESKNAAGTCPGGGEEELYWYSSPDGALVCFDGERSLIALPLGDGRIPRNIEGQLRTVEGKKYMVYITKNGRIVD